MSTKSAFSIVGLAHKICLAAEAQGYNPELLNALAESPDLFGQMLQVQLGRAEVKPLGTILSKQTETPKKSSINILGATRCPPTTQFVGRNHFVVDKRPVRIVEIDLNFKKRFLDKVEGPFAGSVVAFGVVSRFEVGSVLLAEVGGAEMAETTLTEVFSLMRAQGNGEVGPLLTNEHDNNFWVKDLNGVLRQVRVTWRNNRVGHGLHGEFQNGWYVDQPDRENQGEEDRIFFRKTA